MLLIHCHTLTNAYSFFPETLTGRTLLSSYVYPFVLAVCALPRSRVSGPSVDNPTGWYDSRTSFSQSFVFLKSFSIVFTSFPSRGPVPRQIACAIRRVTRSKCRDRHANRIRFPEIVPFQIRETNLFRNVTFIDQTATPPLSSPPSPLVHPYRAKQYKQKKWIHGY